MRRLLQRFLRPFGQIQEKEVFTALLMFSYSFLAMTAYNIIKPITRSKFISDWGGDNLPYVPLATGILIGGVMSGYAWLMSRLPRRWALQITQGVIAALLVAFAFLFQTNQQWVSVAFYFLGLILGILLISQFWTLANVVYDARQAKRLFGFIGGGAPLGGIVGSLTSIDKRVGTVPLLLASAVFMIVCLALVTMIIFRENVRGPATVKEKKGVGARRAIEMLRGSRHLQMIALVISFGAIGAFIIEQQLLLAAEANYGQHASEAIRSFYATVQLATSIGGLVIQVVLTSRIQRFLGIGFALMMLPTNLGMTGLIMLFNAALWAPGMARVLDQSVRYTVDKTTREILYMPLPVEIKYEAKPFVDVTVDRFAKGLGAILMLVLIQPWGLHLGWQQVSYASILITCLWFFLALRARRGYQNAFRQSIQTREIKPAEVRVAVADLSTVEALIQELASPDASRVLYAIDMLESLDKRNLITPLLLYHESPAVRVRALGLFAATPPADAARWLPAIQRMMADESPEVRAAAVGALAALRTEDVNDLVRPYLRDENPRIVMTAAMVLAGSKHEEDVAAAENVLRELVYDTRESAARVRCEFAIALRHVATPHFRRLLIPLLSDTNPEVAEEAMRTVRQLGTADLIFVPTLISLLRDRRLKGSARDLLVGYGEPVLNILDHFLRDREEDSWVRRHIPGVIGRVPCQRSMDILLSALDEPDGALRFKILAAVETLHRTGPQLTFDRELIESLISKEASRLSYYQAFHRALDRHEHLPKDSLLSRALAEKDARAQDRICRYLGLLYPWKDIAAARCAIRLNDPRSRAAALEYLDNLLSRPLRKRLMPLFERSASAEDAGGLGALPGGAAESIEDTVLCLIQDADPVVAAAAVLFAGQAHLASLQDELEEVMPTEKLGSWQVFEAASWVAAAFRLQEARRHLLWVEPLPAVESADRLRRLPLFSSLTVDELFRIVGAGTQVRHERGKVLGQEGAIPESLHLLLDGNVTCRALGGASRDVEAPAALGLQEVLEGKAHRETIRTGSPAVCLALNGEECRFLLSDDTGLLQGLFRTLCAADGAEPARVVIKGSSDKARPVTPEQGLMPIEKALILKSIPVFSGVSAGEMTGLVGIAEESKLGTDAVLFDESEPPSIYALVSGQISLESQSGTPALVVGPNDVIGVSHTLAGFSIGRKARVVHEGTALKIGREDLFDLLSQRPELLQQLFASMFAGRSAVAEGASA